MLAWLIARPKLAAALLLTLALACWHWQDKFSDWWDARHIAKLETQVAELQGQVAVLTEAKRLQDAANAASKAARDRNDQKLPEVRRDTQGRVDRAPTADPAVSLQDDRDAEAAYGAAADRVRGAQSR